jgi:site-specific DNA-methyltransferase (adenine-specific)
VKPYPIGTTIADNVLAHGIGAFNEQALLKYQRDPNNVIVCGLDKGEGGLHPTQKPVRLMRALIELTTVEDHLVVDPFCGSTLVAAQASNRRYIGFEQDAEYCRIARERLIEYPLFTQATA